MPEPPTYDDRRRAFEQALAAKPVTTEDIERMASILAAIRAREERTNAGRARGRRAG